MLSLNKVFIQKVFNKNSTEITRNIQAEINWIAGQIVRWNYELLMLIGIAPEDIREHFRIKHSTRIKERVEDSIFRSHIKTKNFVISEENDSREIYKIMVDKRRSYVYREMLEDLPVEDLSHLTHETTPVMIEEIFTFESRDFESASNNNSNLSSNKDKKLIDGLHLFILVHGYQATSIDMQEIK